MDNYSTFDYLSNEPLDFYGLKIYKPTLKDIDKMTISRYNRITSLIAISEMDLRDLTEELGMNVNDFENSYFNPYNYIILQSQNKLFFLELRLAFVTYIKKDIKIVGGNIQCALDNKEIFTFTKENFSEFQKIIRKINFIPDDEEFPEIISDNEVMKKKFEEKRKLLMETKRKERKKTAKSENSVGFGEVVSSLCGYNMGYNLINIWDLTIYQVYEQFKRGRLKESYESDVSAILAGADSHKIDLVYWIKKINNN